jgi:hypothetical protein
MKTNRFINLTGVAFGLAAFSTVGCAEKEQTAKTALPSAKDVAAANATPAGSGPVGIPVVAPLVFDAASARWSDIKDLNYDSRVRFFDGLMRLEARLAGQISELTTRRAAMNSSIDTKPWDFAMKEMGDSRSYLKDMGDNLNKATAETWAQEKDKVGQAWTRTQAAYDRVKSSTTS